MSKFKAVWFYAELRNEEVRGIFRDRTEYYPDSVDIQAYTDRLLEAYDTLDKNGYDVVNVTPIQMGGAAAERPTPGAKAEVVGYSVTRGAVVVGKKRE